MPKNKKKDTPGQKLWLYLYRADQYDQQAEKILVPPGATRLNSERATKRWFQGMSRHLKESFPAELRQRREELGLTQQELANISELTVTAVAMIERSERSPNLDTAARLCWALDAAAAEKARIVEIEIEKKIEDLGTQLSPERKSRLKKLKMPELHKLVQELKNTHSPQDAIAKTVGAIYASEASRRGSEDQTYDGPNCSARMDMDL